MLRSVTRPLAAAILAVAVGLLIAGCGGGGSGKDIATGLTPAELLTKSATAATALESFHVALDASGKADLSPSANFPGASVLDGPLALSGEGDVQAPDRASIDAKIDLQAFSPQVNLTRIGDDVYIGALGQDFRVAVPAAQVRLLDFGALYPTLAGWMTNPVEAGREDVDGAPTVKVTGAIDPVKAFTELAPLLQSHTAVAVRTQDLKAALKEGTVEAWIGTEDLRPRRVHLVLKADASGIATGVGAIDLDLTATLSNFDGPVDIQAPSNPRDLDLSQLGALTGG